MTMGNNMVFIIGDIHLTSVSRLVGGGGGGLELGV